MKKSTILICCLIYAVAILTLMFSEYRYIMTSLHPYYEDGVLCIEFMGQVDAYDIEE